MVVTLTEIFKILLLVLLIVCAVSVNLTKSLLQAVVIFMSYSSIMCIIWILMESPDLAITEAAVGAGVSGTLFLMTLRRIHAEDDSQAEKSGGGAAGNQSVRTEKSGSGAAGNQSAGAENSGEAGKEGDQHE